jgi:putative tryptophan/tyrosine transport system substrate-binding protein
MRRRNLIAGLVITTVDWPLAAHPRQPAMPVIGFLGVSRGLAETGFVEDRNVSIEYRWADDHYERLPALAVELVQRQVAVLAAPGSPATLPAKAATSVIPTVFMIGSDPVHHDVVLDTASCTWRQSPSEVVWRGLQLAIFCQHVV